MQVKLASVGPDQLLEREARRPARARLRAASLYLARADFDADQLLASLLMTPAGSETDRSALRDRGVSTRATRKQQGRRTDRWNQRSQTRRKSLVTGANRGLGQALVEGVHFSRGAERVYVGTRKAFSHPNERVVPVPLDLTDETQIQRAAAQVESLDLLINNAGVARYDDLTDRAVLEQHLAVNLFGPWSLTQAFLPC